MAFCPSWSYRNSHRNSQVTGRHTAPARFQTRWLRPLHHVRASRSAPVKVFTPTPEVLTNRLDPRPEGIKNSSQKNDNNNNNDDDDDDTDTVISRRLYLLGTLASTVITGTATYRFFIGDDGEMRLRKRLSRRFPRFFAPTQESRIPTEPLDASFAKAYFNSAGEIATSSRLISSMTDLQHDEQSVQSRARALFFYDGGPTNSRPTFSNPDWFNFCLYARLHALAQKTSPETRMAFADRLAERTSTYLKSDARGAEAEDADAWLHGMSDILRRLCAVGWISDFRIEAFDSVAWREDRRASLTVYAISPVTMQTAQLLAEEGLEELSPKVSFWLVRYLRSCGIRTSWEDFYLDDVYKPDPAFYKPTQLATQFDLAF